MELSQLKISLVFYMINYQTKIDFSIQHYILLECLTLYDLTCEMKVFLKQLFTNHTFDLNLERCKTHRKF